MRTFIQHASTASWLGLICVTSAMLGWSLGYRSLTQYLTLWLLAALPLFAARTLVADRWRSAAAMDGAVRTAIMALAIVIGCELLLGARRLLTIGAVLVAESVIAAVSLLIARREHARADTTPDDSDWSPVHAPIVGIIGALLAFAIAFAAAHAPMTLYDSLSYHLFFAGRWVQEHAISIVSTPFSDVAQVYAPGNGELFFAWLMLPFHGDLLARFGQMPFAFLAAATLYLLAKRLGAPPDGAIYPSAFLLLSRPVLEQAIGADVDLICAALFLTALYFGIQAIDSNERRDWALWGVACGLYAGTKYLALVYAPILLLIPFVRGPRLKALWALPGVVVFGLPWYARNWLVAGSPLYPASLTIGGVTLARGAFNRGAMLNTVFHSTDARLLPAIVAHGLGATLCLLWVPLALIGTIAMLRRGWWPQAFVVCVPPLVVALCWFGVPVNVDSRFLMPAIGPALLPFAFLFSERNQAWNRSVHAVLIAAMAWIVIGWHADIPAHLPWFMLGWLSLDGLVPQPYLLWFGALAGTIAIAWWWRPRDRRWLAPIAVGLVAVPATLLTVAGPRACHATACEYLSTTWPYIRVDLITAWQWMAEHESGATVAYTGNNLPYPLSGPQLTNRVIYVNIDGRPRWRFHDYDRAYRTGRFQPTPPLLATSSGELMSATKQDDGSLNALRPRYERMQGIRDAWIDNLQRMNVTCVFIAVLSAYEIDYVWHDDRGFPIEEEWAVSDKNMFHLRYSNSQVRVYEIDRGARSRV